MMVTTLHSSGRFLVVERIDVPGLAAEQALSRSRMARPGAAIPERQMDVADIMVYGAVTEFLAEAKGSSFDIGVAKLPLSLGRQSNKAHMAIDVRVVDVASGRILASQRIIGEADSSQLAMGASPTVHGSAIPLSLGMYNNTPMEQAIRTCIEKAVTYVDQSVPQQYYRHR
jgi:curli biogenesis system outer membrane secretion channel CsgG